MVPMLRVYPDPAAMIAAAVELVAGEITRAIRTRGRAWVVLSGGDTPAALYTALAASSRPVAWENTWWCFGDERWVPHHDPLSNFLMVDRTLFARTSIPRTQIVAVPTDAADSASGASAYDQALRARLANPVWPEFDVVLMGLGADGHTASLFPGDDALNERTAWVTTTRAGNPVADRVTLTAPVFAHARTMVFLVTGASKAAAVAASVAGPPDPVRWPAHAVTPLSGRSVWLLDHAAAAQLPPELVRA